MLTVSYGNAYEIAKAIHQLIKADSYSSIKPYNFHNHQDSLYWIGPSKVKWPAYRSGKFCFDNAVLDGEKVLFCGIHIEKGYGAEMGESTNKTYDSSWSAYRKLERYLSNDFNSLVNKVQDLLGHVIFNIELSSNSSLRDRLPYICNKDEKWKLIEPTLQLKVVSAGFTDPFSLLSSGQITPFLWVDCFVGFYLKIGDVDEISADEIWYQGLSNFEPFVI